MLNFLASIEVISRDFKQKYPDGKLAIVINGDVSSYARYSLESLDRGHLVYKTLSQLAEKYFVVYTFGNHDAFDWDDSELFLEQSLLLKEAGVHLVVGNVDFYPEYADLFEAYADLENPSGKIIRFLGYTLPYGRKQNKLERFQRRSPKVIERIRGINMNIPLKKINQISQINSVVVAFHLGISKVKWHVSNVNPDINKKLKLVFAGHDHYQEMKKINNIHVIDSGAYFSFSTVLLSDRGKVLSKNFFNEESQKYKRDFMDKDSLEAWLIDLAERELSELVKLRKTSRGKKLSRKRARYGLTRTEYNDQRRQESSKDKKQRCIKIFKSKKRNLSIH